MKGLYGICRVAFTLWGYTVGEKKGWRDPVLISQGYCRGTKLTLREAWRAAKRSKALAKYWLG